MQVQNTQPHNVSFGVKVPTKEFVDFMSGVRTSETNDIFLKLTGLTNEKMITTMDSDTIKFAKNHCARQIANLDPVFRKLIELKDNLFSYLPTASSAKNGGHLSEIIKLSDAKDAEKINLIETLPPTLDIPEIKLPL